MNQLTSQNFNNKKMHINHAFFIHIWKTVLSAIPSQMLQKMNQAQELVSYKQDT